MHILLCNLCCCRLAKGIGKELHVTVMISKKTSALSAFSQQDFHRTKTAKPVCMHSDILDSNF